MKSRLQKINLLIISLLLVSISQFGYGYEYLELASTKIFSPGEKVYVTARNSGYGTTKKIGLRVYKLSSPKDYLTGLKSVHYPTIKTTERKAANFFQIKGYLSNKMNRQWRTFTRGNFSSLLRKDLVKSLALKPGPLEKRKEIDFDLFPLLKGYKLLKKMDYVIKKGKYYTTYSKIPLDIKKKGVYLIEGIYRNKAAYTVIMISNISFVTKTHNSGRLIFVTDRKTGSPVKGAKIELYSNKKVIKRGRTNSKGIYTYKNPKGENNRALVFVQKGQDFSLSDPYFYRGYYGTKGVCYIHTSRPVYRPGQKVSFKVIVRNLINETYQLPKTGTQLRIKILDAPRQEIYNKYLSVNEFGSVHGEINLKNDSRLGNYTIKANYNGSNYYYHFKVEKYKKPEYEVKVSTDKKNYIKGDVIRVTIKAKYYFGSPVSKGKVEYHIYRSRYFVPWYDTRYSWYYSSSESEGHNYYRSQEVKSAYDLKLKPDGTLTIKIDTKKINTQYKGRYNYRRSKEPDYKYTIKATVVDQSRRYISGSTTTLVTRSDHHLRISTSKWLYEPDKPIDITVTAKRFDGTFVKQQKISLEFYQESWNRKSRKYDEKILSTKSGITNDKGVLNTTFTVNKPMWFVVKAISKSRNGNVTSDTRYIYVYGQDRYVDRQGKGGISIIVDKSAYKLGDKAKIIFNTPVKRGHLLVTCEATSISFYKVIPIKNGKAALSLKMVNRFAPNTWVNATIVFNNQLYTAKKEIIIPPIHKFINVKVISNKKQYKPGESARFIIKTTDYKGKPVRSEVSVGIVDASVYAIAPDRTTDIRKYFYGKRYNRVSTTSSFYFRFTGSFRDKTLMSRLMGKKQTSLASFKNENDDENLKKPTIRKNFKDEIVWLPTVVTNSSGIAKVNFKFPDNLTRWRTTVRAVTKKTHVGNVTYQTIVRKNLLVRLAIPRFYREMDKAIVSTIVHNYLSSPKKVVISLEGKGIEILNKGKKRVRIPKNGEIRIDWNVRATNAGTATFLVKALTDEESDAVQKTVPVLPHGLETIDSVVKELRKDREKFIHTVVFKDNFISKYTELQIDLAPSVVVAMNAAIPYLVKEPYGCVEQTMSRFMPLVLVDDIVKKVGYKDVNLSDKIDTYYKIGIDKLYHYQHSDGGWGWWTNDQTHPYMTAYALSGILLAKKVGRSVRSNVIKRGVSSLKNQINAKNLDVNTKIFMLRTLTMAGETKLKSSRKRNSKNRLTVKAEAIKIYKARKKLNPYSKGILTQILMAHKEHVKAQVLMKELIKIKKSSRKGVYWEGKGYRYVWYNDTEETTANVLRGIVLVDSNHNAVSQGVRWIMAQRRQSRWRSTKSTAIMIHTLYEIANKRKELSPDYTANIYLNGKLYHTIKVGGSQKSLKSFSVTIPESDLNKGLNQIKIEKIGAGSLYYSSAFKYYERANWFKEKDNGFSINRKYYRLIKEDDSGEITYKKVRIRNKVVSGDLILVELAVDVKERGREYLLIEDNLPSGCEVVKNDRGYTIEGSQRYKGYRSWYERYYAAREVHDERIGIAKTYINKPQFKIEYLLRAEIPGEYRVMPSKVELMYFPEVNGRSNEFKLTIKDKK